MSWPRGWTHAGAVRTAPKPPMPRKLRIPAASQRVAARQVWGVLGPAVVDAARAAEETSDGEALPPDVLRAHLRYVELTGGTEGSVYARRRALARMCRRIAVPLLAAREADLMAWRAGLTVQPESV